MGKKFSELGIGDVIWCLDRSRPEEVEKAYILGDYWIEDDALGVWYIEVCEKSCNFRLSIPKSFYNKSSFSNLYYLFATSEEELLMVSEGYILKRAEDLDKLIQEAKERVYRLEEKRRDLDKLLVKL